MSVVEEPKIRIETREELIFMLAEAAAIEHNVMCCYFYGIWSLKRGPQSGLTPEQSDVVEAWRGAMTSVAVEEMTHLTLVGNLATAIGAAPHLSRPNFPIPEGYHAADVDLELFGFSHALIDHAIFLERPEGLDLHDSPEFVHPDDYHRTAPKGMIMPSAQDYNTIGHLYRGISHGFSSLCKKLGEDALFCGDVSAQISPADAPLPGLSVVTGLASALEAIETIVEQGEGAPGHSEDSHYAKLCALKAQYDQLQKDDPAFDPAWPVAKNPVMHHEDGRANCLLIDNAEAVRVLDLANSAYGHMLRCLVQSYGRAPGDGENKRLFVTLARELMSILTPVCEHLASLPASDSTPGVNAGMTFTMLRDVARVPEGHGEMQMMRERLVQMSEQAARLFPEGHALDGIADAFLGLASKIVVPGAPTLAEKVEPHDDKPNPTETTSEDEEELVGCEEGEDMVLSFDTRICVHARQCVLGAPDVFLSGVQGQWIWPDKMETETLRAVAHNCPSGAVSYVPKGDTPPEPEPLVNTVNIREDGPYAFKAGPIEVAGEDRGFRATLCRCGASKNKPFCDNSHREIGFKATGEPDTRDSEPLKVRNGPLKVTPQKNGPLQVDGNLEIVAGTSRNVDRVQTVRLCRCGGSKTKPFCDNTHLKIGFKSDQ